MTPKYPEFKKITIDDREIIQSYVNNFDPFSDFNFVSLWSYNVDDAVEISFLNENLVVKFEDYMTQEKFFSFLGSNEKLKTSLELLDLSVKHNLNPMLKLIPDLDQANGVDETPLDGIKIEDDPDNYDYILSVEDELHLKGNKFYDKRNLINRFNRLQPAAYIRPLDFSQDQLAINKLNEKWRVLKNKSAIEFQHESRAIHRLTSNSIHFQVDALGVFINGDLEAYTIYEYLPRNFVIVHFEKCNPEIDGLSSYIRQQSATKQHQNDALFINYEQDLGIAGLKKAKSLWHPIKFLKKKVISYQGSDR
jgi:uncharacterized protein